jgi:tRNA (guanosine-2'-O-)-methyltransferase
MSGLCIAPAGVACRGAAGPPGVSEASASSAALPRTLPARPHHHHHSHPHRRRFAASRSYKENRGTVDPLAEVVADPGAWAAVPLGRTPGDLDGPLVAPVPTATSHPFHHPGNPPWPRALKASLTALPTVAFNRAPAEVVSARPSRFPFDGTFTLRPPPPPKKAGQQQHQNHSSPPRTLTPAEILAVLGDGRLVDAGRLARMRAVAASRTWAVLPVLESNHDRGNLGAVARTADALGFGGLVVASPSTDRYRPTRGRCAAGAEKWLDARVYACKAECVAGLRAQGYRIVAAVGPGPGVLPVQEWDWAGPPTAVVLGNEGDGVSDETVAACDALLTIPMRGFVESFNVSVAAALILQTARRALDESGDGKNERNDFLLAPAEVDALTAAMLLRHKGSAWSAPVLEAMFERSSKARRAEAEVGVGVVVG